MAECVRPDSADDQPAQRAQGSPTQLLAEEGTAGAADQRRPEATVAFAGSSGCAWHPGLSMRGTVWPRHSVGLALLLHWWVRRRAPMRVDHLAGAAVVVVGPRRLRGIVSLLWRILALLGWVVALLGRVLFVLGRILVLRRITLAGGHNTVAAAAAAAEP